MNIQVKENSGQIRVSFEDYFDNYCIIQTHHNLITNEIRLRFGVLTTHDNHESTPMSLTQADLIVLLPYLEYFAKHGELPFEFLKE